MANAKQIEKAAPRRSPNVSRRLGQTAHSSFDRRGTDPLGTSNWVEKASASAEQGRFDDALYEAKQAIQAFSGDAEAFFIAGCACQELDRLDEAYRFLEEAARLAPEVPAARLHMAAVRLEQDRPDDAESALGPIAHLPEVADDVGFLRACAQLANAERVPAHRDGTGYWVTSAEELAAMRTHVAAARDYSRDPAVIQDADGISRYLDLVSRRRLHQPSWFPHVIGGYWNQVLGFFLFVGLTLYGISQGSGGMIGFGLIGTAVGAAILYFLVWVPVWKINKRNLRYRR